MKIFVISNKMEYYITSLQTPKDIKQNGTQEKNYLLPHHLMPFRMVCLFLLWVLASKTIGLKLPDEISTIQRAVSGANARNENRSHHMKSHDKLAMDVPDVEMGMQELLPPSNVFPKQEGNPWRPHPDWFLPQTLRTDFKGLTSISPHQVVPKHFIAPVRLSEVFEWKTMDTAKASFLRVIFVLFRVIFLFYAYVHKSPS